MRGGADAGDQAWLAEGRLDAELQQEIAIQTGDASGRVGRTDAPGPRSGGALRVGFSVPRLDWRRVRRILNIGLPAGAEQILLQFALTSLTVVIARFGTDAYAAHQVAWRIAQLSFLPGWGFPVAATTLVGQELGAKQPQRAKESGYVALSLRQMAKHPRVAYSYRLAFGPCFCPFCP